jgi:hypothetical protein
MSTGFTPWSIEPIAMVAIVADGLPAVPASFVQEIILCAGDPPALIVLDLLHPGRGDTFQVEGFDQPTIVVTFDMPDDGRLQAPEFRN